MNSFFLHLLYIGLFLFSNEDRGVSFVTDGIVANVKFDTNDSKYPENQTAKQQGLLHCRAIWPLGKWSSPREKRERIVCKRYSKRSFY